MNNEAGREEPADPAFPTTGLGAGAGYDPKTPRRPTGLFGRLFGR
ncbi:hypothetical protein [Naumannella huperziae]